MYFPYLSLDGSVGVRCSRLLLLFESTLEETFWLRCPNLEQVVKWFHVCGVADRLWDLSDGLWAHIHPVKHVTGYTYAALPSRAPLGLGCRWKLWWSPPWGRLHLGYLHFKEAISRLTAFSLRLWSRGSRSSSARGDCDHSASVTMIFFEHISCFPATLLRLMSTEHGENVPP